MENGLNEGLSKNTIADRELIRLAKEKSAVAFETLLKKYRKSVYYLILKMVRNTDDAEDLTQEAFAKAFKSLDKFDAKFAFSTWLFRIATNNCIDHIRKRRVTTISIDLETENEDGEHLHFDVRDEGLNPNDQLTKKQRQEYLKRAMETLPVKFQHLLELRYFQELSYEEVAVMLALPVGTVKAQLYRARELLNEAMSGMQDQV
jgi:RNA polymerase sigma factor (sigma-70 family)